MALRAHSFHARSLEQTDKLGAPIGVASSSPRDGLAGYERLLSLAGPALREAAAGIDRELPLVLALPEPGRADDEERLTARAIGDIADRAGVRLDAAASVTVRLGHAGFGSVLLRAFDYLHQGAPLVVVGGADTYLDARVLTALDEIGWLFAPGGDDGFVPGEAAAFLVLSSSARGAAAAIGSCAVGEEVFEEKADLATCLTDLLRRAGSEPLDCPLLTDLNGQRRREAAMTFALGRLGLGGGFRTLNLPFVYGDIGAATGAVACAVLAKLWQVGAALPSRALVVLSSTSAHRAVVSVEVVP